MMEAKMESRQSKRQARMYIGSMAVVVVFGVMQVLTLSIKFSVTNLLILASSIVTFGLYVYGIIVLNKKKLHYSIIRRWLLGAYAVMIAMISVIFSR